MSDKTLNQIILDAGIEIVRYSKNFNDVKLRYDNKEIYRGFTQDCYLRVKKAFGIDLRDFEEKNNHITKTFFYIRNPKTDECFDTDEMIFRPDFCQPNLEEEKHGLQKLINEDPEKFKDCIIDTVTF